MLRKEQAPMIQKTRCPYVKMKDAATIGLFATLAFYAGGAFVFLLTLKKKG